MVAKKQTGPAPTVEQIQTDVITQLANRYWAPFSEQPRLPYSSKIVEDIYRRELISTKFSTRRVMLLEFSQYLENYLWPNYSTESTQAHVLSIAAIVNEKFRERVPAWECFNSRPDRLTDFFRQVMTVSLQEDLSYVERTILIIFLTHCFNSLADDIIRDQVLRLVSLGIWIHMLPSRREDIFGSQIALRRSWKKLEKKIAGMDAKGREIANMERNFIYQHLEKYLQVIKAIPEEGDIDLDLLHYCERFLELLIDLEAQLLTRRFFSSLLDDSHAIVYSRLSPLSKRSDGKLFRQLLDMLQFYAGFEINDFTGEPLTDQEMTSLHYDRLKSLQEAVFKHFPDLRQFALANIGSIDTRDSLLKHFKPLSNRKLHEVAAFLKLVEPPTEAEQNKFTDEFLLQLLVSQHERRSSQLDALNEMPLYPTDEVIWDENIVPTEYHASDSRHGVTGGLALPKLNLQFLTLHDYLLRNFHLFRMESTYEIRQDIEQAVWRMKPLRAEDGSCHFDGWARMAQIIEAFSVVEVAQPHLGENHPARVRADITINLNYAPEVKREWEALRKHDVAFLLTVRPPLPIGSRYNFDEPFVPQVGLMYVRGCEIEGMLDENGRVIEEGPEPKPSFAGNRRTYRVFLDPNQYQKDMTAIVNGQEDPYESFNIILRRKPKENNFKAVLETIRDLMNTECVVPDWILNIILGYGNPAAAHYSQMTTGIATLDWNDTFLSLDHLKASFQDYKVVVNSKTSGTEPKPPFKITFPSPEQPDDKTLIVEPHVVPYRGPLVSINPKRNQVLFTPTQIEAIRSGMQPGLTMVVGPPGTGKTDVAVQIISNIYHNFPEQRTLIVTHSNQALNQLFEKIMALDVEERHLLRLGHGEEQLETQKDFSRYGRVNFVLGERLVLLQEVARLHEIFKLAGEASYTCETAGYFYVYQVLSRWEEFLSKVRPRSGEVVDVQKIADLFPFMDFFNKAPQPIFKGRTFVEDFEIAEGCFRHIKNIFTQLEEFRAFELLRSGKDRTRYLQIKEAKIIAMTCTHAALKRRDLIESGFQYDNILMEETAQILEIETFIPLLLQVPEDGYNRLKRWIMIGDHHQLPPVIKNMAFQKFSNMEQSLFTRFVRLSVPTVDLDAQGRARPSLCELYNWRYKKLGNLPHVCFWPEYRFANPGFTYDFQLINVEDFNGVGESEPEPYFYQNLAEAEYVVAVYMYMRLIGYPAEKISILTTYNGQKFLIRDVIKLRCSKNPLIGNPHKVTTVDRYQGQQNDFILLSLVRTRAIGHIRDVRRLVVALSRARLGLYVFARVSLFQNCFELTPAFNQLMVTPSKLHLAPYETYPPVRKTEDAPSGDPMVVKDMAMMTKFVYDFYSGKLEQIKEAQKMLQQKEQWSGKIWLPDSRPDLVRRTETRYDQNVTEEHPGVGSDSDMDS